MRCWIVNSNIATKARVINIKYYAPKYNKMHVKSYFVTVAEVQMRRRRNRRSSCEHQSRKSVNENNNKKCKEKKSEKKAHRQINEWIWREGARERNTYVYKCYGMLNNARDTLSHIHTNAHSVVCYILCERWWWMRIMEQLIKYIARSVRRARTSRFTRISFVHAVPGLCLIAHSFVRSFAHLPSPLLA